MALAATILIWTLVALICAILLVAGYFVHATRRIASRAEQMVPAAGSFVTVDGVRLHYLDAGEGLPILFLHGLGAQLLQFQPLFSHLKDNFRVIALDRPGSGYSAAMEESGPVAQARIIAHFIDQLKLDRKPVIVGHSLGGLVALAIALEHPSSISGLALISPLTWFQETVPPEFKPLYIPSRAKRRLLASTVAIPTALKYAPQTLAYIFAPQTPPADYMTEGGGWVGLRPSHFLATVDDFTALEHDLPALEKRYGEIARSGLPSGLLFGTADRVLDYERHGLDLMNHLPGLEIKLLDGVGHMPHFSDASRVAAFIRRVAARAFQIGSGSL
ncbi:alpha/beta fold hydrolase [Mesorhizobium sp. NBSH29]|uniref:alpha/beta fold hydrolase n=1 Tax=Mesorhizobium sp. NBSH29 TaxID=2654249 RepID=UPI0018964753|nr:alpha/beta hydrolase [Mesorhizobium sp. NBSH29]QPC87499.1 alpha/beta fold hydrolase [Mesorhizobium sp. NBSH29]